MFIRLGNDTGWSQHSPFNSMEFANRMKKVELVVENTWNSLWEFTRCYLWMYSQRMYSIKGTYLAFERWYVALSYARCHPMGRKWNLLLEELIQA